MFLCFSDICRFFTIVSLAETIEIGATALYDSELKPPVSKCAVFIDLIIQTVTSSVEFTFNVIYRQFDGESVSYTLGPSTC